MLLPCLGCFECLHFNSQKLTSSGGWKLRVAEYFHDGALRKPGRVPYERASVRARACACVRACTCGLLCPTPWTIAVPQAPLSAGFSRQEYWSGLPFSSLGGLPDPGTEPTSPVSLALRVVSLPLMHGIDKERLGWSWEWWVISKSRLLTKSNTRHRKMYRRLFYSTVFDFVYYVAKLLAIGVILVSCMG